MKKQRQGKCLILILAIICLVLSVSAVKAQQPTFGYQLNDTLNKPKTVSSFISDSPQKRPGRALLFLGIAEFVPWVFDRYVTNKDYAKITWGTVKHNVNPSSWAWDNDEFQTNQIGHPYHGSLFYSSFRTNGYNFWQSAAGTMVGSYLWETFAENQAPAPNDFVNTSFGGIVLGEMTYRLSNRVINKRSRGFKRQASEVLGFLINPMNGLTRIMDGKWGKVSQSAAEGDSSKINAEFDLGARRFSVQHGNVKQKGEFGWFGSIKLIYGDAHANYRTPFSNLYLNAEFGQDDSSKLNIVSAYGSLAGWQIKSSEQQQHLAILSANYDYIHNEAFSYSGQSVKINLVSSFQFPHNSILNASIGTGPVLLAAVPDPYHFFGRTYDYCSGLSLVANGDVIIINKLEYSIDYRSAYLYTVNGNQSHYMLHSIVSNFRFIVNKQFSLTAGPGYFTLRGKYAHYPNVNSTYPFLRLSVNYNIVSN